MHLFRVGPQHEGGVPKETPELLMKSFVIFMTSKNDLQQRDETLFAIKFRRAELLSLKDPQTIISEVGSCYRYYLGGRGKSLLRSPLTLWFLWEPGP
jgi:hypothetical protein